MGQSPATTRATPAIAVIGAGVVGAAVAYVLCRRGAHVTLIDRAEAGRGCSYGSAGAIYDGLVAPLAMPWLLTTLPRLLLDRDGPLRLPVSYLPRVMPWLVRSLAAGRPDRVDASAAALAGFLSGAVDKHLELAREVGAEALLSRRGHLHVYPDAVALSHDAAAWALSQRHGLEFERVDRAGIVALEPRIAARYTVGCYVPGHAMVLNPLRYVQQIVRAFVVRGGRLTRDEVRGVEPDLARGWSVHLGDGKQNADHVVVAAGMQSAALLEPLGVRLPLESQRGYHVTLSRLEPPLSRVVVLGDRRACVTPMQEGVRIAGAIEFGGLSRPASPRRSALLARHVREAFTDVPPAEERHWMGHRPCTPNAVPLVGPVASRRGLWLATGHGHLGLTGAVHTAQVLADAILEGLPAPTPAIA